MKALSAGIVLLSLMATGSIAHAKNPPRKPVSNSASLKTSLKITLAAAQAPGQAKLKVDRDQGDDHASARAIQVVCSKSTPAARRSAICPVSVSPE